MRTIVLAALAAFCLSSASLAAEKNPNAVLTFDLHNPAQSMMDHFVERYWVTAEHNAKVLWQRMQPSTKRADVPDDDPIVFVLWVNEKRHAIAFYQIVSHELESDLLEDRRTRPDEKLTSFVIKPDSPHFDLTKQAFDEVITSTVETIEMPQTAKVNMLLAQILPVKRVTTVRYRKD